MRGGGGRRMAAAVSSAQAVLVAYDHARPAGRNRVPRLRLAFGARMIPKPIQ
jgi:hypothetical protein